MSKRCSDCGSSRLPDNSERYGKRCIRCHVRRAQVLAKNREDLKRRLAR